MPARTDEAVGVGGTGASNWSEPTKSSSMQLKDFIPEARAENYVPPEDREANPSGIEYPLPAEEMDNPLESMYDDPVLTSVEYDPMDPPPIPTGEDDEFDPLEATLSSIEATPVGGGQRGRPKGRKETPGIRLKRKNPERYIEPASPREVEEIEAAYARAQERDDLTFADDDPDEWARKKDRVALDPDQVSAKEADAIFQKMLRLGKNPKTKYRQPGEPDQGLTPYELQRLHKFWAEEAKAEREGRGQAPTVRRQERPSAAAQIAAGEPDLEDVAGMKNNLFFYSDTGKFQRLQPEAFEKFSELGVDPQDGIFVRLKRGFRKPKPPASLSSTDPGYDEQAANAYYGRLLLYRLSKNAPPGSSAIFWSSLRDWSRDEVEDGRDFVWDGDSKSWDVVYADDIDQPEPEKKAEPEYSDTPYGFEYWNTYIDPSGRRVRVKPEKEIHASETQPEYPDVGSLDPAELEEFESGGVSAGNEVPEDIENWEQDPRTGRYFHKETGDLYGYRPGLTGWERRTIAKDPTYFRKMNIGKFDDSEELKKMKLNEFFNIDEAHGERAANRPHGYPRSGPGSEKSWSHTAMEKAGKFDDAPDVGGEPGDEMMFQGGDPGFSSDDPTSSQDNPVHDDFPGAQGGPMEAPPGVFQDASAGGFGDLDQVSGGDDEELSPTPGSPEDPEVAGSVPDPGFGAEEDEWARMPQTGEPRPEDRTRVNFVGDKGQQRPRWR